MSDTIEKREKPPLTDEQRRLVRDNVGLVHVHLRHYVRNLGTPRRDREWDDLFQEGCLGLMQAAGRFRADSGIPFAAFALPRIHNAVSRALRNRFSTVHVPPERNRNETVGSAVRTTESDEATKLRATEEGARTSDEGMRTTETCRHHIGAGAEPDVQYRGPKGAGSGRDDQYRDRKGAGLGRGDPYRDRKRAGSERDDPYRDRKRAGSERDDPYHDRKRAGSERDDPYRDRKGAGSGRDVQYRDRKGAGSGRDVQYRDRKGAGLGNHSEPNTTKPSPPPRKSANPFDSDHPRGHAASDFRPKVRSLSDEASQRLCDARRHDPCEWILDEEATRETIGQRLRHKYERAVRDAGGDLGKTASRRGDRDELIRVLQEERFLVPQEESRRALRQIARDTKSSYARVAQCDKQIAEAVRSRLESDPEFVELRRHARENRDGCEVRIDDALEHDLAAAAADAFLRRFHEALPVRRALLLDAFMEYGADGIDNAIRRGVTELTADQRERLLWSSALAASAIA